MREACENVKEGWFDELEDLFTSRQTNDFKVLSEAFCGNGLMEESISRACYGVDPRAFLIKEIFPDMKEGA